MFGTKSTLYKLLLEQHKMQAIVLTDIRKMELQNVPHPAIAGETDVLLKIEKVGVCGSDVHYWETGRIGDQVVEFPFKLGHECAATVVDIGSCVKRVKVGDQVAVDPAMVCHRCDQCLADRENTCRNLRFLGCPDQAEGCLCEYIVMDQTSLYRLESKITLDQAVLCEPLSIGVYAVRQAQLPPKAAIAILGAGPIGLSVLVTAYSEGVNEIYVTDKIDARVEAARKAQCTWAGNPDRQDVVEAINQQQSRGMDAVFECAGQQESIDQAVELLKPGGKLMLIGIPRDERISFVIDRLRRKEITVINVRRQRNCVQEAIEMIAAGKLDVDFMITHKFTPEQTQKAFDMVAQYSDGVIKALIEFAS